MCHVAENKGFTVSVLAGERFGAALCKKSLLEPEANRVSSEKSTATSRPERVASVILEIEGTPPFRPSDGSYQHDLNYSYWLESPPHAFYPRSPLPNN